VFSTFKTAARHVNAAAIVNAGIDLLMDPTKGTVAAATIVFNGLTASLLRATAVEKVRACVSVCV
jgi:xanthine dehydrogenase iron-sulfur cluster and FAD-binding subunit A